MRDRRFGHQGEEKFFHYGVGKRNILMRREEKETEGEKTRALYSCKVSTFR